MDSPRKALITGASTGIGAAYAERLAKRGYDLILVARHEAGLKAISGPISGATGRAVEIIAADLTNGADLARIEQVLRTDSDIDLLVNNAGTALAGDLAASDPARIESMILLNVLAPTRLSAAVLPGFAGRRRGTLINISSTVALTPERIGGVYSGSKAYLLNLSLRLQQEVAGKGITVQVVLPGAIRTALWEKGGIDIASLPENILMDPGEMVDAALAGLDNGERVTIPSLPDAADWEAYEAARKVLLPNLSRKSPAPRYRVAAETTVGAQ